MKNRHILYINNTTLKIIVDHTRYAVLPDRYDFLLQKKSLLRNHNADFT